MDLRYPIGPFVPPSTFTPETRREAMRVIAETPAMIAQAVDGLDDAQLATPYRPGGWTVRQVVHHVPDSHLNAYVRFKLALTEETPTIKPYDEALWAKLPDSDRVPVQVSLELLQALHTRWDALLRSLSDADFQRRYNHPETGQHTIDHLISLYAWHGPHHTAHITSLRQRMAW